jgi:hypothetical protein
MTLDANSRVQIIENPVSAPGTCAMCGTGSGVDSRKFIDFGFQLDWYGSVIFCEYCMASVAEGAGYISSIEYDTIKKLTDSLSKDLDSVRIENRILKNAMVHLCNANSIDSDLLERFVFDQATTGSQQRTTESTTEGQSKTNESSSKQGPKRVRSSTSTKSE